MRVGERWVPKAASAVRYGWEPVTIIEMQGDLVHVRRDSGGVAVVGFRWLQQFMEPK